MKMRFKTILVTAFTALSAFVAITYTSCNRDKCKTIVCAYGGVCNGGTCVCPTGYEGTNCETISRDKFMGNWSVFEKGSITQASQYGTSIEPAKNINEVVIRNFYNYFRTPILAYISHDTITIPNQQYEGKVVFGVGYIHQNMTTYRQYGSLTLSYEIIDTATIKVNDFGYNTLIDKSKPSEWNK